MIYRALVFFRVRSLVVLAVSLILVWQPSSSYAQVPRSEDSVRVLLAAHAVPLNDGGKTVLLSEAREHDFFLLGELHGETNIPNLLRTLWPELWHAGYHHVAAELSPWAAENLQKPSLPNNLPIVGLWTRDEALILRQFATPNQNVLWGCDIEEGQPEQLIREMARLNPANATLQQMSRMTEGGYKRNQAAELLKLAETAEPARDAAFNGISLWRSLRDTLIVERLRSKSESRLPASDTRELVMKHLFLTHYRQEPHGKVFFRFGRNHLHRGYDARGVSTLGNFAAEFAVSENKTVFNVGAFAAGGKEHLAGKTFDADERQDEPTFALLADLSHANDTLFDLRPLRAVLHSLPPDNRSSLEANLVYWADSYDFLLCYPVVSPLSR
jgi:hypothetical protein